MEPRPDSDGAAPFGLTANIGSPMREGSLEAPTRHPLDWHSEEFYDLEKIDEELRRVFDICHGCRRCFNLCDSFPRLFDLIDESESGELDTVSSKDFDPVIDACTMCDMCFMTKCPYVPPHEFNLDFPHLILRYRAAKRRLGEKEFVPGQLAEMDRNGKLAGAVAPVANWASATSNKITRPVLEKVAHIDAKVELPKFHGKTFVKRAAHDDVTPNPHAPAFGRKAAIYATCFTNYNAPKIGEAARKVLAINGVDTSVEYPACCGMPFLEQGDLARVAEQAEKVSKSLRPLVDQGLPIIVLTASCGLMMKFEWPLILPDNEDVKALSEAAVDIDEYLVDIAKNEGLADGMSPIEGGVTVHLACHARAQNMGPKAADLLKFIPDTNVSVIERCAGHGGTFGVMKETHDVALKTGKTAMRNALKTENKYFSSECPLAAKHMVQGMGQIAKEGQAVPEAPWHPVEIMAKAYGLID